MIPLKFLKIMPENFTRWSWKEVFQISRPKFFLNLLKKWYAYQIWYRRNSHLEFRLNAQFKRNNMHFQYFHCFSMVFYCPHVMEQWGANSRPIGNSHLFFIDLSCRMHPFRLYSQIFGHLLSFLDIEIQLLDILTLSFVLKSRT